MYHSPYQYNVIYVFTVDDEKHKDLVKIGKTTLVDNNEPIDHLPPNCETLNKAAQKRIDQYTKTLGAEYQLCHTELAVRYDENGNRHDFSDKDVHDVLRHSGIKHVEMKTGGQEWFKISPETAIDAIEAVKAQRISLKAGQLNKAEHTPIVFRSEQKEAVKRTVKAFKSGKNKFFWNAKMRFGKTLTALEVVKEMGFERTIIATHRPVVNASWYDDFNKLFYDTDEYTYGSKALGVEVEALLKTGQHFVYFASIQDLRGSAEVGGKFVKNGIVFETPWDCVIVDEAHEGTTTERGEDVIRALCETKENSKLLSLSGTPFNILDSYEENTTYTWDYVAEQDAKAKWDEEHFGDSNPYANLPKMNMYTFDLGELFGNSYLDNKSFNFHEFFRTWTGEINKDYAPMPEDAARDDFVHKDDVLSFLNQITKANPDSHYPYASEEYRDMFHHTLWMVPGVKEAKALSQMLKNHPVFGFFEIVNVAGDGDKEDATENALDKVKKAIKAHDYTITLSCGKLTTGVTVPEWTAVMMLAGSATTSAMSYLQTIFRVQSPCHHDGKIKSDCYVFDFAPDRALRVMADSIALSTKPGMTDNEDKEKLGNLLNFCPIIAVTGTGMKEYDAKKMIQTIKRAYAQRAVDKGFDDPRMYSNELLKHMSSVDVELFRDLHAILGKNSGEKMKDPNRVVINELGMTDEDYEKAAEKPEKERTKREKKIVDEVEKNRRAAISILRAISVRMPLMIYGADIPFDENFTLEMFLDTNIVDDQSWQEFMPKGLTREMFREFIRYYDEDIFVEAGRTIREQVKNADALMPRKRVKAIAAIFSHFKNPDKETVLTPWRVVNMHLADALGGYSFYDEKPPVDATMCETPRYVDHGAITRETLGNEHAHILEINAKTGLYPLYVAYSIYCERVTGINSSESVMQQIRHRMWGETLRENIFVVCKTPMAKMITRRMLCGYNEDYTANLFYFDGLIETLRRDPQQFITAVKDPKTWGEGGDAMHFDAVVGNPPYQEERETNNKNYKSPVYHLFIDAAREIADKGTLIHPGRFLFNAGDTPKDWNQKMLHDKHFKVIDYWVNSLDVFSNVSIKGGVAVTFWDKNRDFGEIGVFCSMAELGGIHKKVGIISDAESIISIIYNQTCFDLDALYADYPEYATEIGSNGRDKRFRNNAFDKIPAFTVDKVNDDDITVYGVVVYGVVKNKREWRYIARKYCDMTHENLDK